ncbi:DUF6079 family protein [Arthrobacter burdickii]|uniref:DUF6079 family protein n=1 Tax=Arthrobacter burdickii TaxID=3035920 RepID=A0ABT8K5P4_9MICC|nr:DUF6079 family protein [Arthrobacter burdickii]MDN4612313.1 DUF6079 family protein [Arthrobacter burdickii]
MTSMLLRDVFDIPERAGSEDYVLRLTDSVSGQGARHAVQDYVVTPAIADAFDAALGLVGNALETGINRGAFLAGSFGSGKSHFMAVLHSLLRHNPDARSLPELQSVVARHDPALQNKKILPLAFHFIDAKSMEQELFESYIKQIQTLHPEAPLPAFFPSEALLRDADGLRTRLGDDAFFEGLGSQTGDDEWAGVLGSSSWDRARYDAARAAAPQSAERQELVSALVEAYFQSYARHAEYVDLDTGLEAMSNHANALGYDAVVLFLDELVLWLAFAMQTPEFFRRESQKLTKLVEGTYSRLPAPLISFVARQMDLRRWFADSGASGSEQEALDRAFRHQEGRFSTIVLGDDNLPYVASRRLLKPKDDVARHAVEDAFSRLDRAPSVWDVLLDGVNADDQHRGSDESAFRMTYPFSPALVSTLRFLASVMQRDRTALKVMQQMLVDRRDTLSIDDVIPVGDSFEYIVRGKGDAVLDPQAAALFRSATQLYQEKLQPLILRVHGLVPSDLDIPERVTSGYRADDRLARTLLLSAVAPKVPALKGLTAGRLASLNHGSIVSPLRGGEAGVVLSKVREWARHVPEIHVDADPRNPVIRVQLSDVDYESIVERAKGEDNAGRQRELLRGLVVESLGVDLGSPDISGAHRLMITWRGSRREVEIVFGNIRDAGDITEDRLQAGAGAWRFVIDHPFDEAGHSLLEDIQRIDSLRSRNFTSRTVLWVPRFLSAERLKDLRRLVILDWLLSGSGDRWTSHADHLGEVDRAQARNILEAQHSSLRDSLLRLVQQAYGASSAEPGALLDDGGTGQVLWSLDPGFAPAPPVGASLASAFQQLAAQAFDALYPDHPRFEPVDAEVRPGELRAVLSHLERAAGDPEHRVPLEGDTRAVRRVANALRVGEATETHFLFGDDRFGDWGAKLVRGLARNGVDEAGPVTVAQLRAVIDDVEPPQGLRPEISDLVILGWGLLRQRAWFHFGAPLSGTPLPGTLQPAMELRPQPMPSLEEWNVARKRASIIFGAPDRPYLTPSAVAALASDVREKSRSLYEPSQDVVARLDDACSRLGIAGETGRLELARRASVLVGTLRDQNGVVLIRHLAGVELPGSDEETARSLSSARIVAEAIKEFPWDRLDPLKQGSVGPDGRAASALRILDELRGALRRHELAESAVAALRRAENDGFKWVSDGITRPIPGPGPGPGPSPNRWTKIELTDNGGFSALEAELAKVLESKRKVEVQWRVVE